MEKSRSMRIRVGLFRFRNFFSFLQLNKNHESHWSNFKMIECNAITTYLCTSNIILCWLLFHSYHIPQSFLKCPVYVRIHLNKKKRLHCFSSFSSQKAREMAIKNAPKWKRFQTSWKRNWSCITHENWKTYCQTKNTKIKKQKQQTFSSFLKKKNIFTFHLVTIKK